MLEYYRARTLAVLFSNENRDRRGNNQRKEETTECPEHLQLISITSEDFVGALACFF